MNEWKDNSEKDGSQPTIKDPRCYLSLNTESEGHTDEVGLQRVESIKGNKSTNLH